MSSARSSGPWWEPTWRRMIGTTVVLFLVILAFLVGRVRSGADPALAGGTTRPAQQAPALNDGSVPQSQGVDPSRLDPGTGGGTDDFGNATPDQSGGSQSVEPPSTHVS